MCIKRMNGQMSLVGSATQDRSIKREDGMERASCGIFMELSTLVSGRVPATQMVRCITCKMTAHTVSLSA